MTLIRISRLRYSPKVPVFVNGAPYNVPVGVDTDQPAEVLAALDYAGVAYRVGGGNGVASGTLVIRGTGSRVATALNGTVRYYDVGKEIPDTQATRDALDIAGVVYVRSDAAGSGGYNVPGFPIWTAALNRVKAGGGDAIVATVGDSHSVGTGAGDISDVTNANGRANSVYAQLMAKLAEKGLPIDTQALYGSANRTAAVYPSYDPSVTMGAGWGTNGTGRFGMNSWISPTNNASLFTKSFTNCTHVKIAMLKQATTNQFTYAINGGAMSANVNLTGTGVLEIDIPMPSEGSHTLSVAWSFGSVGIVLLEMVPRNVNKSQVRLLNIAGGSMSSVDWSTNTAPQGAFQGLLRIPAPDLWFIRVQSNDELAGDPTGYQTRLGAIIDQCASRGGDIVVVCDVPRVGGDAANATYNAYVRAVCAAHNIPPSRILDLSQVLGISSAYANANGFMADAVHENRLGYSVEVTNAYGPLVLPA
jgi:hypothetical protein